MPDVNKAIVMEALGRDPKTKDWKYYHIQRSYIGVLERQDHWWTWIGYRIVTSNQLADIASKYLKKGRKVYIEVSLLPEKGKTRAVMKRK